MKRGTPDHPKMSDFAELLLEFMPTVSCPLPLEVCQSLAVGIVERLHHFTARYAPAGDIGKMSDLRIARAVGWTFDEKWLLRALTTARLVDAHDCARLYVHDWHDHSDEAADKWLSDKGLTYANGCKPRRRNKSRPRRDKSRQVPTGSRQSSSSSESKPSSKSSSEPTLDGAALPPLLNTPEFIRAWNEYRAYRRERSLTALKPRSVAGQFAKLESYGHDGAIESLQQTIRQGWQGLFTPKAEALATATAGIRPIAPKFRMPDATP